METTLKIIGAEEKESKAGRKYIVFDTSQGKMSCFDNKLVEGLKKEIGNQISIDFQESNGFKNIKKILTEVKTEKIVPAPQPAKEEFAEARAEKNKSIYTSYAKDIFIAHLNGNMELKDITSKKLMEMSIELVKQAIAAF